MTPMTPGISPEEREYLQAICQAVCAWIEGAERKDGSAARTYYALYDERHEERRAVLEACDAARGGGPLLAELIEAVAGLVGVEYEHGVGPLEAAAETVAGDVEVSRWAARVERAHRAWIDELVRQDAAPEARALEDQRLGFEQLAAREPYHAWISFNAAVRGWKGETSGRIEPPEDEAAIPVGCGACFCNPDITAGLSHEVHRRTGDLVDESHLGVRLAECVHCGQPSVQIFEEEIDWVGGDDAQRYTIIAIKEADLSLLRGASPDVVLSLAKAIGVKRVRMWWDHPTGKSKTTGRTMLRRCNRCQKTVLAWQAPQEGEGLLGALIRAIVGGAVPESFRCRHCGSETVPEER